MKIIDLLNKIANEEEVPEYVKYFNRNDKEYDIMMATYENIIYKLNYEYIKLNDEAEILDEEDKDIPLIPVDELYTIDISDKIYDEKIDYNFRVLKEKINQLVEEFNSHIKENK